MPGSFKYGIVSAGPASGGHGPEHGGTECGGLFGCRNPEIATGHIGVNLHQHFILFRQSAAGHQFIYFHAVVFKGFNDNTRSIGGGLDQRPVNIFRPGSQGRTD